MGLRSDNERLRAPCFLSLVLICGNETGRGNPEAYKVFTTLYEES